MNLDERVVSRIHQARQELESGGNLPSRAELDGYRRNFRERFGPDRLAQLDGAALLETMHAHGNKESLVYWLEFKDDDEFRNRLFGGIGGGTALKFGLFARKETGVWVTGSAQNQKEILVEEAIHIARRHRDQLLRGVQTIESLPAMADEARYAVLQQDMQDGAPDVAESAWGHKYFHLLFPEKLDDFHAPSYQRFHLIKMLQAPPEGDGRYIPAGRYVSLARELGIPMNQLTSILNAVHGRPYHYWRIGTRLGGTRSIWDLMRADGCVAVGWPLIRNLSDLTYDKALDYRNTAPAPYSCKKSDDSAGRPFSTGLRPRPRRDIKSAPDHENHETTRKTTKSPSTFRAFRSFRAFRGPNTPRIPSSHPGNPRSSA